ncbi:site-specific integrase [Ottowia sp. GY511]|uniref:Site-specific integrase n=1 Tax=Ottowia flava TaxID=2675430 RepID=A0ABW4KLP1_9BURK|nr:site-specific integrase [Ottowia sp. GY511]
MAGKRKRANGTFEYVFKRAGVLDKPLYFTFTDEAEGDAFAANLDKLLASGIVPTQYQPTATTQTLGQLIADYTRDAHPSHKDLAELRTVDKTRGTTPLTAINAAWVDDWISVLKRVDRVAPDTIRAKVGALARCCDWGMRLKKLELPDHPFRTLPNGYSQYTKLDAQLAGEKRVDVARDRRLERGEHERIMAMLDAGVLPRKQRPLQLAHVPALRCLYLLATETAMRLSEMYTLTVDQVALDRRTVFLDRTKNGDKRQVPLSTVAVAALQDYLALRQIPDGLPADQLFPWWDGDHGTRARHRVTDYLSKLWVNIFDAAGCDGLKFHDLRHEATSRLFERTRLSEMEIMKITGHKDIKMLARYANLRGSVLSERLW